MIKQSIYKFIFSRNELKSFVLNNTFNIYDGYLIEEKSSGKIIYKLYKLPNNLILNIYNNKTLNDNNLNNNNDSNGYGYFKYNNL